VDGDRAEAEIPYKGQRHRIVVENGKAQVTQISKSQAHAVRYRLSLQQDRPQYL